VATAVIAVYQVAYAALVVTGGRLGDGFGRRRIFVLGVLAFTAASLWCGLARSGAELVLARLAQGASAALMVPQVLATIHTLFPGEDRARAFVVFGCALGLGGAVGFALGGWLVTLDVAGLGWRSVFLVNLPIGLAIAAAGQRLLPAAAPADTGLDLPGAAALFAALVLLVAPVLAGPELGWPIWLGAAMLAGSAVLGGFVCWQRRLLRRGGLPLIDPAVLGDRAFRRGLATVLAFQMGNVSFYLLMTLFMQGQLGFTPLQSGLAVVPLALAFTAASQLAGRNMARFGIAVLLLGCVFQLVALAGLGGLAAATRQPGMPALIGTLAVFGFGQGLVMAPLTGLVLATVPARHAGLAAGLVNTIQQSAGAIGVALVSAAYLTGGTTDRQGVLAALAVVGAAVAATGGLLSRLRTPE
jgi:MFS family permease